MSLHGFHPEGREIDATYQGYFLIADISGYTGYLSQSELDHAQQTLTALLNLLIDHTKPPLVISRLAGDAVISYGLRDHFYQGQTFVELIEDTYVAFRRAIDLMVLNTTCGCNACKNIRNLDLKFFVHYGAFGLQQLGAHQEMVGTDVNLIHRLLKNSVTEATGWRAYALYTDVAIRQLGLEEICSAMTAHQESYEHIGRVPVWVQDLQAVWEAKKEQVRMRIPESQELLRVAALIRAGPELVWDFLNRPEHLSVLLVATETRVTGRVSGRVAASSVYRCYHGESFSTLTILNWQPFERILIQASAPLPVKGLTLPTELILEPVPDGTRLVQVFGKASGPAFGRLLVDLVFKALRAQSQRDIDRFAAHVEAELTRQRAAPVGAAPAEDEVAEAALAGLEGEGKIDQ